MEESKDNKYIPMTSVSGGRGEALGEDIYYYTNQIVNVVFVGKPNSEEWVLIDAGMPKSGKELLEIAEIRYGKGNKPSAILLTHGHFDHVGGLVELLEHWPVPVYAHPEEFPFLTGLEAYPKPDSSVDGGLLAKLSSLYPHEPIDITEAIFPLPEDQSVPGLPEWEWVHTPGHSPGHMSFFREMDRALVSGDAVITVRQDSFLKVFFQTPEVQGPPRYLTPDWKAACNSVCKLAKLEPSYMIPGHGSYMEGEALRLGFNRLVSEFPDYAVPDHGRFTSDDEGEGS
jgi:glyoxylase-like metal-dependent hydrolase (beta-lactamase superfamily II)